MSETLRWILIGFSVVLLLGIYWWGRRGGQAASSDETLTRMRPEPRLHSPTFESEIAAATEDAASDDEVQAAYRDARPISATRARSSEADEITQDISGEDRMRFEPPRRNRIEPTFSEQTAELPVDDDTRATPDDEAPTQSAAPTSAATSEHAPTLAMSATPAPRRIERRKIVALRLAAGAQRVDGGKLRAALEAESLQHGKYDVFHRLHSDGVSIFSVASMVEPGTFDPIKMTETQYPGVTIFMQLPGPVPGMHALNEMVACARSLHQALGGTLQDERGVPLTVHRIERLRQEVREFERPPGAGVASSLSQPSS